MSESRDWMVLQIWDWGREVYVRLGKQEGGIITQGGKFDHKERGNKFGGGDLSFSLGEMTDNRETLSF